MSVHVVNCWKFECTFGFGGEEDDLVICSLSQVVQLQVFLFGSCMANLEPSAYGTIWLARGATLLKSVQRAQIPSRSAMNLE